MTSKPAYSKDEFKQFIATMRAAKEAERTDDVEIFTDRLFRASVVIQEGGGQLWIVPRSPGGWHRRHRLRLTPEARRERLRPARGVSADWLGIPV